MKTVFFIFMFPSIFLLGCSIGEDRYSIPITKVISEDIISSKDTATIETNVDVATASLQINTMKQTHATKKVKTKHFRVREHYFDYDPLVDFGVEPVRLIFSLSIGEIIANGNEYAEICGGQLLGRVNIFLAHLLPGISAVEAEINIESFVSFDKTIHVPVPTKDGYYVKATKDGKTEIDVTYKEKIIKETNVEPLPHAPMQINAHTSLTSDAKGKASLDLLPLVVSSLLQRKDAIKLRIRTNNQNVSEVYISQQQIIAILEQCLKTSQIFYRLQKLKNIQNKLNTIKNTHPNKKIKEPIAQIQW